MRDIVIIAIVAWCFVMAFKQPFIGFLCWEWLSLMTPHRLAYGYAYSAPLAMVIIIGILLGLLGERNKGRLVQHGIVVVNILFILWTVNTTIFAMDVDESLPQLNKYIKIMLGVFVSYMLVVSKEKLNYLLWVMFLSVGYYGIKGGVFTLLTGGSNRVWGPPGSFIEDNNHLACALLMVMPLGGYLLGTVTNKVVRYGLIASMVSIGVSILGSSSRGALLGLVALGLFWIMKAPGKQKIMAFILMGVLALVAVAFMPESYWSRMNTVKNYEEDQSAMGRINAWTCAFNLAKDRITGAGFNYASPQVFSLYAPNPRDLHTGHSIYFQVLGDHGFIGLALFLLILLWAWLLLKNVIKVTSKNEQLSWANRLARMLQLSLISYSSAGAFLSLPYYDLYWQIIACTVILNTLMKGELVAQQQITQGASVGKVNRNMTFN